MKKIIVFMLLFAPFLVGATIDQNLYYGMTKNSSVRELQQFLLDKAFSTTKPTGNFYAATRAAVKKYQAVKNISTTGNVGTLTRQAINADMLATSSTGSTQTAGVAAIPAVTVPFSGSLNLVQNPAYVSQTILAPQPKFKIADFSLTNNTIEAVNVNKVEADLLVNGTSNIMNLYLSNLYLSYGNSKTLVSSTLVGNNYFFINFKLPSGQTIDLSLYADISSYSSVGTLINSGILVSGVSDVSNTNVYTNSNAALFGQNITVGSSSLTASVDVSTPASRMIVGNQKVVAGKFQFTSLADSYNISQLGFVVPNLANSSLISSVTLVDTITGNTLATTKIVNDSSGDNSTISFITNIPVNLNSSKLVTVYYDLSKTVDSRSANINIAPVLKYITATNSSGNYLDGAASNYSNFVASYNNIILPATGLTVNPLYVFKSLPTFVAIPLTNPIISSDSNISLYKFSIAADPSGDVSVKQLNFVITLTDPNNTNPRLANFSLYKGETNYSGAASIGLVADNNFTGLSGGNSLGVGAANNVVLNFIQEEVIPAGKTQIYILKADATNFNKNTTLGRDSVSVYLSGDTAALTGGHFLKTVFSKFYAGLAESAIDQATVNYYNLLWSDMSEGFPNVHNYFNGSYTNDWYDGFGLVNLPLAVQTIGV